MKTVLICASPKKRFAASQYFLKVQRMFIKGTTVRETLRNGQDHARILQTLTDADNVVFFLPLYVDAIPAHVLSFMQEMTAYCHAHNLSFNVYAFSNGGFIEGKQNKPLMQVFKNFCARSNLNWCGGIGVGGGVMLNVMSIVVYVYIALLILNLLLNGILLGDWFPLDVWINFLSQMLTIFLLNLGVLWYAGKMGTAINRGAAFGEKYTRILIPSFVFILFADIFFVIISFFEGGLFRGWLSKK